MKAVLSSPLPPSTPCPHVSLAPSIPGSLSTLLTSLLSPVPGPSGLSSDGALQAVPPQTLFFPRPSGALTPGLQGDRHVFCQGAAGCEVVAQVATGTGFGLVTVSLFLSPDGLVGMAIVGGMALGVAGLAGLIGLAVSKSKS